MISHRNQNLNIQSFNLCHAHDLKNSLFRRDSTSNIWFILDQEIFNVLALKKFADLCFPALWTSKQYIIILLNRLLHLNERRNDWCNFIGKWLRRCIPASRYPRQEIYRLACLKPKCTVIKILREKQIKNDKSENLISADCIKKILIMPSRHVS